MREYKRSLRTILVILSVTLFFLAMGCERKPSHIKISLKKNTNSHVVFVALEKGFFEAEGLDVEAVEFESTDLAMQALAAGQIDVVPLLGVPAAYGIEQNNPGTMKIFLMALMGTGRTSDAFIVNRDSPIKSLSDLQGKKIGHFPGVAHKALLEQILANAMESPKVDYVSERPSVLLQALAAGQVDAVYAFEPLITIGLEKGIVEVLLSEPAEKYVMDPLPIAAGVMTAEFVNKHPQNAQRIIRAMYQTVDFVRQNPEETMRITAKHIGMSEESALKLRPFLYWELSEVNKQEVQKYADMLHEHGVLKQRVDTTTMFLETEGMR